MSLVYVLNSDNEPLMPTHRCGKVRRLLRDGLAKVVSREPFTIKLLYQPKTEIVQELTLGVDTGSKNIGTAVVDDKQNVLYASQVIVRDNISKKMSKRRGFRRTRRNRKTRYRQKRYSNRKNSKRKDRFSPTMTSKYNSHIKEIEYIKSILPIKNIVLETGTFDVHALKNPALKNEKVKHWGYQKVLITDLLILMQWC